MDTKRTRIWQRWAAGAVLATVGAVAATAWAQGDSRPGPGPRSEAHAERGFGGPRGMERRLDRLLDRVKATPEQRSRIHEIARGAAVDLRAERDAGRLLHERTLALLAAPAVDEAAVEALRREAAARHDAASRRISQALVDGSRVLTPAQRVTLAETLKRRHARGMDRPEGHRRGPPPPGPVASAPAR